jgi:hypothetical protein
MATNREKGNKLEDWVVEQLKNLGDIFARRSRMSGGRWDTGDVVSDIVYAQCKKANVEHITISRKEWQKLENQIPVHMATVKPMIYVNENKYEEKFVTMEANDFFRLLKKALDKE